MSRTGHTFTRHFDLETRQHELFGFDLGEGAPRRALVLGFMLVVGWTGGLFLIFGSPSRFTFSVYFVPPLLIAVYGTQRSRKLDRRQNLTQWVLAARYLAIGHRPIVNGGRRAATRGEWLPLRARLGDRAEALLDLPGLHVLEPLLGREEAAREIVAGPAVPMSARARLYGPDQVWAARQGVLRRKGSTVRTEGDR
ncbi:hypothetical protein ACWCXH_35290 [Kitasatospora sp. NPDC001660]